jgi:hypothetical protein
MGMIDAFGQAEEEFGDCGSQRFKENAQFMYSAVGQYIRQFVKEEK